MLDQIGTQLFLSNNDLKPCPFCGGDAFSSKIHQDAFIPYIFCCGCDDCGIYFEDLNEDKAIKLWNQRAEAHDAIDQLTQTAQEQGEYD